MILSASPASYRQVMHLAWPVILSNLSVPLLGAVDTAVIGHLPDASKLGAVAVGALVFSFLYWGFGFLRMGTTGFVSQAHGAGDATEIRAILARALLLGAGGTVLILLFQVPVVKIALSLVEASPDVSAGAEIYFKTRVWGAPAVLVNYCLLGMFIGLGKTKAALITQVFMNAVNIVLDLVFVMGLDMGVSGVALATAMAEYMAVIVGAILLYRELNRLGGQWVRAQIFSFGEIKKLMSVNRDIFIRTILLIFAFAYFTASAAKIGVETLAATAVAMNFMNFLAFGLDGFAFAAESMVGNAIGARQPEKLREVVISSSVLAVAVSVGYAVLYAVMGEVFINMLTSIEAVREDAYQYLPWLILMPVVAVWSYQFDGIFIGAMRTKEMRNGMIYAFVAYFIAIEVLGNIWGIHGLWAALVVFMIARGVSLAAVYPRVKAAALTP